MITRYWNLPAYGLRTQFEELDRMRRYLDQVFGQGEVRTASRTAGVYPPVNLTEAKEAYYLRAELPGVTAENLDIQTTGRNITITGERKIAVDPSAKYHRRERGSGRFARAVALPGDFDRDRIDASLRNGILQIVIPKSEAAKPKQIKIK